MNTLVRQRHFILPLLVCFFFTTGCGPKAVSLAPVSGKITVDNQPVTAGQVTLVPLGDTGKMAGKSNLSAGTIDSSGVYTIYTDGRSGAPLGKYKVTVTPSMVPTGAKEAPTTPFNAKYTDVAKTDAQIEVIDNAPPGKYDLKLSK
jgi:hypothetical protein